MINLSIWYQNGFLLILLMWWCPFSISAQTTDSLDIKIGQMILMGYSGTGIDSNVLKEVASGKVGAILIFEKNIPPLDSYIQLKKTIWTYKKTAPLPLWVSIDQEGGKVNRLKSKYGFPPSVSNAYLGKNKNLDSVAFYSECTASTLAGLGINLNFAPVVDVAVNPKNTVIVKAERSYSTDPIIVAQMAAVSIRMHRRYQVTTVLKHFPGHGSSSNDTHTSLADVTKTWSTKELLPYKYLIDSSYVDGVMSAHIVNFKLDSAGLPGTLSKIIIDEMLRKKLNFNGVVFSDDMQMAAIAKFYGLKQSITLAIQAGVDVLCFSNNMMDNKIRTAQAVHSIIKEQVLKGVISKNRIDESFKRIMALKKKNLQPFENWAEEVMKFNRIIAEQEKEIDRRKNELDELNKKYEKTILKDHKRKKRDKK